MGRERDGERVKSRRAPVRPRTKRRGSEPENTGSDRRARGGVVDSTQATEKRECAPEGKVQSITGAKSPVHCSNRGSAGPSEKVETPATECDVELLEGRRTISNELKSKRGARENTGNENRRREGKRETFTKAPSAGLVKETISAEAEKVDVRAPRESG